MHSFSPGRPLRALVSRRPRSARPACNALDTHISNYTVGTSHTGASRRTWRPSDPMHAANSAAAFKTPSSFLSKDAWHAWEAKIWNRGTCQ